MCRDAVWRCKNQNDVFAMIKGLVNGMIAKLEKEAEEDAAEGLRQGSKSLMMKLRGCQGRS